MSESAKVDCECLYPNEPLLAYSCCPIHGYKGNEEPNMNYAEILQRQAKRMQDGIESGNEKNMTENTSVVGEETLDTSTLEVKEIPLVKKGKYPATLNGFSKHVGKEWNSVPNVSVGHKLTIDGKPGRVVFGQLLMSTHPDVNGNLHIQRQNGAKALLKVLGTEIQGWKVRSEKRTNPAGEEVEIKWLDPDQLIAVLEQFKGSASYQVNVIEQPANKGYPAKNEIFSFSPAE